MFRRILVPLDGSERAEQVLDFASLEARAHDGTLILMRVIPPLRHTLMVTPALMEDLVHHANEIATDYLDGVAERLETEGIRVEKELHTGLPAQRILEFAENEGCDLIIIGSRGATGALQWQFGSVSSKVIRTRTSMPVMVVNT